jgi:hypothetical protein
MSEIQLIDKLHKPAPDVDPATGEIIRPKGDNPWKTAARAAMSGQSAESDTPRFNPFGGTVTMGRDGEGEKREADRVLNDLDVAAYLMECSYPSLERAIEQILIRRRSPEDAINLIKYAAARLGMDRLDPKLNRFTAGTQWAETLAIGDELPVLWFGLYDGGLHLCNGMSGAGKSSVWYNVMLHLTAGKELWGIQPARQERVFYMDPENRVVRPHKLQRISEYMDVPILPERLAFHDGEGIDLADPRTMKELGDMLLQNKFTGLVIDPWVNLFQTINENDNAEAARQGKSLLDLIKRAGVWVLAIHHTGKSGDGGGRGASAREGISRVVYDLVLPEVQKEKDDDYVPTVKKVRDDAVRLYVRKDGIGGLKASIYLQMLGAEAQDSFKRITYKDWLGLLREGGSKGETIVDKAIRALQDYFANREEIVPRAQIIADMKGTFGQPSVTEALDVMVNADEKGNQMLKKVKLPGKGNAPFGYFRGDLNLEDIKDSATGSTAAQDYPDRVDLSATHEGVRTRVTNGVGEVMQKTIAQDDNYRVDESSE